MEFKSAVEALWHWGLFRCWPLSETCSVDWGAWGTVVSAGVGLVTVGVAVLAWKTSERAAAIADRAADIAQQQHKEAVALRQETARIIGRLVVDEVSDLPRRAARVATAMSRAWKPFFADYSVLEASQFDFAMREADTEMLPTTQGLLDRIHNLPDELGSELAKLNAACTFLRAMSSRVRDNTVRKVLNLEHGSYEIVAFRFGPPDFLKMGEHARRLVHDGAEVAHHFQTYAGVNVVDYTNLKNAHSIE